MKFSRSNPVRSTTRPCSVVLSGLALLLFVISLDASPHVVGYERFHGEAPSYEGGLILFSELGCASCHGGSPVAVPREGANLNDLKDRVDYRWIVGFLKNPEEGRSGSNMPKMVHGLDEGEVEAVAAFLGTLGEGLKLRPARHANAERGSALYHEKGCVACHAPTPDFRGPHGRGDEWTSALAVAHPDLRAKTSLVALTHFLSQAGVYRKDGRMPHPDLDQQEAIDLASHLLDFQASDPREAKGLQPWPKADEAVVARGKALVQKLNCASCHSLTGIEAAEIVPLDATAGTTEGHCLSATPVEGRPFYDLDDGQRASLRLFLVGEREENVAPDEAAPTLAAMNCYACHERDGVGGPTPETNPFFLGDEALGDSGRLPPPLTGIGHKLRRDWLEGVLAGSEEHRVRPYLKTEMPGYQAHAKALAAWFEELDVPAETTPLVERAEDLEAGRKLLGVIGGTNCITCHVWGPQPSLGIQALDIASLDERLRPDWFREYLLNPASYRAGTLMPPLWPGGQSMVPDVLEGDAERQIAAIWTFIREGEGLPEGFPDVGGGQFELIPEERPIIQRTFLERTGSRAILVGFPGEIHLAYDGGAGRPSLAWRGRFFDAYNTWFTRAAPFESPIEEKVYPFAEAGGEGRFRGYQLDEAGNPTFLVVREGRQVEEGFRVSEGTLVREVSWDEGGEPVLGHPEGVEVEVRREAGERQLTVIYSWK